jgi:hypothetical protein
MIRLTWASTFQIAKIELSDKERACQGSTITVNHRSMKKLVVFIS